MMLSNSVNSSVRGRQPECEDAEHAASGSADSPLSEDLDMAQASIMACGSHATFSPESTAIKSVPGILFSEELPDRDCELPDQVDYEMPLERDESPTTRRKKNKRRSSCRSKGSNLKKPYYYDLHLRLYDSDDQNTQVSDLSMDEDWVISEMDTGWCRDEETLSDASKLVRQAEGDLVAAVDLVRAITTTTPHASPKGVYEPPMKGQKTTQMKCQEGGKKSTRRRKRSTRGGPRDKNKTVVENAAQSSTGRHDSAPRSDFVPRTPTPSNHSALNTTPRRRQVPDATSEHALNSALDGSGKDQNKSMMENVARSSTRRDESATNGSDFVPRTPTQSHHSSALNRAKLSTPSRRRQSSDATSEQALNSEWRSHRKLISEWRSFVKTERGSTSELSLRNAKSAREVTEHQFAPRNSNLKSYSKCSLLPAEGPWALSSHAKDILVRARRASGGDTYDERAWKNHHDEKRERPDRDLSKLLVRPDHLDPWKKDNQGRKYSM